MGCSGLHSKNSDILIPNSYSSNHSQLSYLGCVVIFARMGDIIGRRNAYMSAFIIFFAFSIGCGFSQSRNALIACRALQGVGGSGLYSLTLVIFPEITPQHLTKWLGSIVGIVLAVSGVLGPVLGGVITHYATWRWIFWIKYVFLHENHGDLLISLSS